MNSHIIIGLLALHGDFRSHAILFKKIDPNIGIQEVRSKEDLEIIDALVIPGGESTTIGILSERFDMTNALKKFVRLNKPIFGTCAGLIMLSNELISDSSMKGQPLIGGLDVVTYRNFYGGQTESFLSENIYSISEKPIKTAFIRAPAIVKIVFLELIKGENVEVIGKAKGIEFKSKEEREIITAVKQNNILALTFHPEITKAIEFHVYFLEMVRKYKLDKNEDQKFNQFDDPKNK